MLYNSYLKPVYYSIEYSKFKYIQFSDFVKLLPYYIIAFTLSKIVA